MLALAEPSLVQIVGFSTVLIGAVIAAWFGYLGQKVGIEAKRIAQRVEKQVTPNGGTTQTTGDATVRIEAQLEVHRLMLTQAVAELQAAVTRDDGRFARSERDLASLRDEVASVGRSLAQLATDHEAIMRWIEQHTTFVQTLVTDGEARLENLSARLGALETDDLHRREEGS